MLSLGQKLGSCLQVGESLVSDVQERTKSVKPPTAAARPPTDANELEQSLKQQDDVGEVKT